MSAISNDHIHPSLRSTAIAASKLPSMAQVSHQQSRDEMAERTAARQPGPQIDKVVDLQIPGPAGTIPVRMYVPNYAPGVTMAFHGGGWLMGNLDSFDAVCRNLARDSGLAVVSVDYRLAPEHPFPAAIDDAWAATCWIAEHGHELGLATSRMTVFGESAGGNLAAVVCLLARDQGGPNLLAQALVYPATDARLQADSLSQYAEGFMQRKDDVVHAFHNYALDHGVSPATWKLSPLLADSHAGLPPAIVITAECDTVRDDGEAYAMKLAEAGVPAVCVRYLGMLHTFYSMRGKVEAAAMAQRQVADVLRIAVASA